MSLILNNIFYLEYIFRRGVCAKAFLLIFIYYLNIEIDHRPESYYAKSKCFIKKKNRHIAQQTIETRFMKPK